MEMNSQEVKVHVLMSRGLVGFYSLMRRATVSVFVMIAWENSLHTHSA